MPDPASPGGERGEPVGPGSADSGGRGTQPAPFSRGGRGGSRTAAVPAAVATALLFALALFQALGANNLPDFFINRAGAAIGLQGQSPYDLPRVRQLVAEQFPDPEPGPDSFVNNCGYFQPPLGIVAYAPFAAVPWTAAKVLWAVVTALAAWWVTRLPDLFRTPGAPAKGVPPPVGLLLPFLLLLNPLTLAIVLVGQTTLVSLGCVAAGQWCFERGRPALGAALWAVPFVKPHVALPLLPLAWYLGGWRRAAAVLGVVVGLNLLGGVIAGGTPLFVKDYLDYLSTAHKAVLYNRAELNPQITSWNRLLYAATAPFAGERFLVEQTAQTTVAGYLVWFGLLAARCGLAGVRPSPSWAVAAAMVGVVLCCQVLVYELFLLTALTPWLRDLFAAGWRTRARLAIGLMVVQLLPREVMLAVGVGSHRSLGVALLAALVLIGPLTFRSQSSQSG